MLKFIIAQNLFLFMTPSAAVNLVNAVDVVRHHATSSLPSKNPQGHLSSPLRSDENLRDKFSRHSSNPRDHRTRRSLCLQVRRHVHSNESTPIFLHPDVVANGNASVKQKIRHIPWNTSMKMLCNEAQNIGSGKTTREITGAILIVGTFVVQIVFLICVVMETVDEKERIKEKMKKHWSEKNPEEHQDDKV